METTGASFMKLKGQILEMIWPGHARIQTPKNLQPQLITIPGRANSPIRIQQAAFGMEPKYSMLDT